MSRKEKSKFDKMGKVEKKKVCYDQDMKDYGTAKGGKKSKDSNTTKR
jgi:high mobility group protein B3